jgi:tetratricopeptide (TPR) repeat protein
MVALALAAAASAQTAGRMTGVVRDADGHTIKGATIRAINDDVGATLTSTTDDKGRFAIIGIRTGNWRVEVEAPDFLPMRGQAAVTVGNPPNLQILLQHDPGPPPGALSKTIADDIAAAEMLRKAGRYDEAIAAYQAIQAKNSKLTAVSLMLGLLYREKAQQEKDAAARQAFLARAIAAYNDMLKADDTNARARLELGVTQMAAGNADAASKAFEDVIAANPKTGVATEAQAHLQDIRSRQ